MKTLRIPERRSIIGRALNRIAIGLVVVLAAGCASANRLREAQDSFNQAAAAENAMRFDAKPSEAVAGPAKNATEAEAIAKTAAAKLAAAKAAVEAKPEDQDLLASEQVASKDAEEAESKSKTALETKVAADKASTEAETKAKADAEAQIAAEKAEVEAPAKLKDAEKNKELAENRVKETAKTAEPRDVTLTVYSAPINLKITPALTSSAK